MLQLSYIIPLVTGIAAFFLPAAVGRSLLLITGVSHGFIVGLEWFKVTGPLQGNYFSHTPEGMLILAILSLLFIFISFYTAFYMKEAKVDKENIFHCCMLLFLSAMSMVTIADHIIMFWVAVEATTLMSAPLIFVHRSKEALEATWKYIMICSVGIALALLGCFLIIFSRDIGNVLVPISFSSFGAVAKQLDPTWLKVGFIFILIGYGTKMGLAPMHTWLPDAHSEAPSPASALLSGALLNCAFLGVYKGHQLMYAAGLGTYSSNVLISFGLLSMLVSAVFILDQTDYKRMLAYSSIENMGIIVFGIGIGGLAAFGALIHMLHHSLLKSSLFLSAGNILLGYNTKIIDKTGGIMRLFPKTGIAFFAGFAGISGFPPFGLFISELLIIFGAIKAGRHAAIIIFITCLILIFAGASRLFIKMTFKQREQGNLLVQDTWMRALPPLLLLLTSLGLVTWLPDSIYQTIQSAIFTIGATIND